MHCPLVASWNYSLESLSLAGSLEMMSSQSTVVLARSLGGSSELYLLLLPDPCGCLLVPGSRASLFFRGSARRRYMTFISLKSLQCYSMKLASHTCLSPLYQQLACMCSTHRPIDRPSSQGHRYPTPRISLNEFRQSNVQAFGQLQPRFRPA